VKEKSAFHPLFAMIICVLEDFLKKPNPFSIPGRVAKLHEDSDF